MLESVGIISGGGSGAVRATSAAEPAPMDLKTSASGTAAKPLSPQMKSDPLAGVMIAQYFLADGELSIQLPSATVVAYLRAGLTENGMPTKDPNTPVASVSTEA